MTEPAVPPPSPAPRRDPLAIAALGVAVVALGLAALGQLGFESRARAWLLKNPQVIAEAQAVDARTRQSNLIESIDAAAAANPQVLAADPRDPAIGPADARVVVHQFFDYRCPYCKLVAEPYLALAESHPDVRFVFKEWPILDGPQEGVSAYAARAALAAQAQGRYVPVHQALMAAEALDPAAIDRILAANGVDMARARPTLDAPATTEHLAAVHQQAAVLGLQGTPTFFVAGKVAESNDPAELDRLIRAAKGSL